MALRQDNLKRLLGYSSVAHMGYVLVAFVAGGAWGAAAATFYFPAYFTTLLGIFGILIVLSDQGEDLQHLAMCRSLVFRPPYLGSTLTVMLFSLAGIPLTAGFMGKFYVLGAGIRRELIWLALVLVVDSTISLFYYLRVALTLFAEPSENQPVVRSFSGRATGVALGLLVFLLFWIGTYPTPCVALVESATTGLR